MDSNRRRQIFLLVLIINTQSRCRGMMEPDHYFLQLTDFCIDSEAMDSFQSPSNIACAMSCLRNTLCESFNFNSKSGNCSLFRECFTSEDGLLDSGWLYFCSENPTTAFYSMITYNVSQQDDPVKFDKTYTNIGGEYDTNTGAFTSKDGGVYVFAWTMEAETDLLQSSLKRNGIPIGELRADPSGVGRRDTSTNMVAVELSAGDKVEVYIENGTAQSLQSTFSGWEIPFSVHRIAFHASRNSPTNQPIDFNSVLLNEGNHYMTSAKSAVVQNPGYYYYFSTIESIKGLFGAIHLMVNGNEYKSSFADGLWANYDSSSLTSINNLSRYDIVSIEYSLLFERVTLTGFRIPLQDDQLPKFAVELSIAGTGKIIFDQVYLNVGGAYNSSTGEFTATVDGTYVFTWRVGAARSSASSILFVNGNPMGYTYAEAKLTTTYTCYDYSTGVAVLALTQSDVVYIWVSGIATDIHATFEGFLLDQE